MARMKDSTNFSTLDYYNSVGMMNHENWIPEEDCILHSRFPDPEQETIKKDLFNKLSEEAKDIIKIIINAPYDFIVSFCNLKFGSMLYPTQRAEEELRRIEIERFAERKWPEKRIRVYVEEKITEEKTQKGRQVVIQKQLDQSIKRTVRQILKKEKEKRALILLNEIKDFLSCDEKMF